MFVFMLQELKELDKDISSDKTAGRSTRQFNDSMRAAGHRVLFVNTNN